MHDLCLVATQVLMTLTVLHLGDGCFRRCLARLADPRTSYRSRYVGSTLTPSLFSSPGLPPQLGLQHSPLQHSPEAH